MQNESLYKAFAFAEKVSGRSNVESATADLSDLAGDYGLSSFALATFSGPGSMTAPYILSSGWDPEWENRYLGKNYVLHDPVIARARRSARPFVWADTRNDHDVTPKGLRILDEARAFKMNDGVLIPVHGPRGMIGSLTFGGDRVDLAPDDFRALHLAGMCAYSHVLELAKPQFPQGSAGAGLTARETECLKWCAAGLTSGDIADRLGISRHTADWYLKEASRKLGAANRTHAVALAFRCGLIG
ncbi:LuxR family transcriptional regulator [Roseibium aggregatum]|uniref:LuxR family transcriptional regulator n=1 Tax=Roseibium aggregatum TaxID=187304 RepID=A0A926NZ52_9HYPH|nr:LuxR family transcriptional regulator [Roseibium aggregatum]MBD1546780.1 LuxR family transcriptional regulator [Roseibium aggregatum]